MKRIISLVLSMVLFSSVFPVYAETVQTDTTQEDWVTTRAKKAEEDGNRYAYFQVKSDGSLETVNGSITNKMGFTTLVEHDGKYALKSTNDNSNFFFAVDNNYWGKESEEGKKVAITVEYFDTEMQNFSVHYNYNDGKMTGSITPGSVETTGTGEWKTHTLYTDYYVLGDPIRIRSTGWHSGGIGLGIEIRSLFIEENRTEYPIEVTATNGEVGMIYSYQSSDAMTVMIENTYKKATESTVKYIIRDREQRVLSEGDVGTFKLETGEKAQKIINTGVTKLGIYTVDFVVTSDAIDGGEYIRTFDFSILYTYEDGDERYDMAAACTHFEQFYWGPDTYEVFKRFGFSGFRSDGSWNEIETSRKQYVKPGGFTYVEKADKDGLENMTVFSRMNGLYSGSADVAKYTFDEASLQGYADAASWLATGFGNSVSNVKYIEMFNEWNHTGFNSSGRGADGYLEYAKVAYPAIKKANPDVQVIAGGTAGCDVGFIKKFVDLGGLDYCDGISVHPYQGIVYSMSAMKQQIEQLNQVMIEKSGTTKPIYFTEMGFSRANDARTTNNGIPEKDRRSNIPQMYLMCDYMENVAKIYWYDLVDDGPLDSMREHRWGLFKHKKEVNGFAATDGMATLSPILKWLPKTTPERNISINNDSTIAYEYKREDGSSLAAIFTTTKNDSLTINLGCEKVKVYDMYGNLDGELYGTNGVFTFDLSNEIVYVDGTFPNFEIAEKTGVDIEGRSYAVSGDIIDIDVADSLKRNLRVELDYNSDNLTVTAPNNLTEGVGTLGVQVKDGLLGSHYITIKLYDGDKLVYVLRHLIELTDEYMSANISSHKASTSGDSRWQVKVDLENKSRTMFLSGSCQIIYPKEYVTPVRRFYEISPESTRSIMLNLPEMLKKRTQNLKVQVKLDNGYDETFDIKLDFTSAMYADKKPEIDGVISKAEWKGAILTEDRAECVDMLSGFTWKGIDDLSLDVCRLAWDEDNFYYMAQVKDDMYSNNYAGYDMWQGDGVQFGILQSKDVTLDVASTAFTEIGFSKGKNGLELYRFSSETGMPIGLVENFEGAIKHQNGVTTYELRIPWSELFGEGYKASANSNFAFSFLVNDNDGTGRKGWVRYNEGIGYTKNPKEFGNLFLTK